MSTDDTIRPGLFVRNLFRFRYRETMMAIALLAVVIPAVFLFPGGDKITSGLQSGVTTQDLLLFALVVTIGAAVKGMSGFGYALIVTPIAATIISPTIAVVVLSIPPWMLNVFQVGETQIGFEYVKNQWTLILLALVGSFVGVFFLASYSTGPLIPFIIGLILLAYVVYQVVQKFVIFNRASNPIALGGIGLVEGFFLGAANLGPLLPAYLHTFERNAERYIGGLSMVFMFVFTERIIQMLTNGLMTPYRLWLGAAIAVVTLFGLGIGTFLRRLEIDEERFNWVVIAILFVIGLNILRKTAPHVL